MAVVGTIELVGPRVVTAAVAAGNFDPWLEVVAWVRVRVPGWDHRDDSWVRWAIPGRSEGWDVAAARPFFPGLRSARRGEPPPELRSCPGVVGAELAGKVVEVVLSRWRPRLHRQADLGVISGLDEPLGTFRRRCLAGVGELLLRRGVEEVGELTGSVAALAAGIETCVLGIDEIEVLRARVSVGWYPAGVEPAVASADLMVSGAARSTP